MPSAATIIDRPARDALVQTIEDYLAERTDNFDFDEAIFSIDSQDPTVKAVSGQLWCLYDDCTPHRIVANKVEWDFFQRIILLLKSDRTLVSRQTKEWQPVHMCAALTVVLLGLTWWIWNVHVLVIFSIAAPISWLLRAWAERTRPYLAPQQIAVYPFSSTAQLRDTYHTVPFRKHRYPTHLVSRRIRSKALEQFNRAMSLLFAPLMLIEQAFPETSSRLVVE